MSIPTTQSMGEDGQMGTQPTNPNISSMQFGAADTGDETTSQASNPKAKGPSGPANSQVQGVNGTTGQVSSGGGGAAKIGSGG
ncbi:hypothetical protein [Streptomyces sp. NBC_00470]|uniref:hypothetical protein n=1 Tax=Streptomyces sp. NBC_00470 TaxID=2975753 RepID=UPI0030DF2410